MPAWIEKFLHNKLALALSAIVLTGLLVYGIGIPFLGYYHDDWYMLWSAALRGPSSLVGLFKMDRPFMGVVYWLTYLVLRDNITAWHVYTLLWRIAGAIAFYWILNLTWPRYRGLYVLAAMLFLVYPGFLSIPNAATKVNHLTGFAAALFSIALTLKSIRAPSKKARWLYMTAALAFMFVYLMLYEYMVGLEAMRLALMFWITWQGNRTNTWLAVKRVLKAYLPYVGVILLVAGVMVYRRAFVVDTARGAMDIKALTGSYMSDFMNLVLSTVFQTVKDFLSTIFFAWGVQPYDLFTRASSIQMILALMTAGVIAALAAGYLAIARRYQPDGTGDEPSGPENPWTLVVFGVLITLAAVVPVVATIHRIDLLDEYKSYGLHPSPGVIIFMVGLVAMLKERFRATAMVGLIVVSVMAQSLNTQDWALYWQIQRNYWWQLTWRAPDIKPETLIMAYAPPGYAFQQDYEIWAPVNLIYYPKPDIVPAVKAEVLNQDTIFQVYEGQVTDPHVRDIYFPRDFRNLLLLTQPTVDSCVHVIDRSMPVFSSSEQFIIQDAGKFSSQNHIETGGTAPVPPASIFGKEPEHDWCYYYEKASLARQQGDWAAIGVLYDEVKQKGLKAGDAVENFVFVEGLTNVNRVKEAVTLAENEIRTNPKLRYSLCQAVNNAPEYPDSFGYRREIIQLILCVTDEPDH